MSLGTALTDPPRPKPYCVRSLVRPSAHSPWTPRSSRRRRAARRPEDPPTTTLMGLRPLQSLTGRRRPGIWRVPEGSTPAATLPGASHEVCCPYSASDPHQLRSTPEAGPPEGATVSEASYAGFASPDYVTPLGFLTLLTYFSDAIRPTDFPHFRGGKPPFQLGVLPASAHGVSPLQSFSLLPKPWRLSTPATLLPLSHVRPALRLRGDGQWQTRSPLSRAPWIRSTVLPRPRLQGLAPR